MYRIVETQDYYPVSVMCHECGLEVEPSETAPGYVQRMWKCEDTDTGKMVAAAVTGYRDGRHVLENLVVSAEHRSRHLGENLMKTVEHELRCQGVDKLWGCAKVPDYYTRLGWKRFDGKEKPVISNCQTCRQFGNICFPEIIVKELQQ